MPVATLTCDRRVCTFEHESRLLVVIKKPLGPLDRVMTERAVLRKATIVRIILAVTVEARSGRILKNVRFVTGVALHIIV